nr:Orf25 [Clostridioides difficile]
MSLFRRG